MQSDADDWGLDLPQEWQEKEVARLSLEAQASLLPAVGLFVREIAQGLGLTAKSARELEHAVDEAATNVIQHAFPGGSGQYTLIMLRRPGQVVAALEDKGIPFDLEKFQRGESTGLGYVLIRGFADEIRVYNRGPFGKRLEIIKKLAFDDVTAYHPVEELDSLAQAEPAPAAEPLNVCQMEPGQAVALARCVYRAYGYSYLSEYIYFPDQIREMLAMGRMVSFVAVNSEEEIVGHAAILPERPGAKVGEIAQIMVDPRYREHGVLPRIAGLLLNQAQKSGMLGLYALACAQDVEVQKEFLGQGAREAGAFWGYGPAKAASPETTGNGQGQRQTELLFYFPLNPGPARTVYPPAHLREWVMRVYQHCGLHRQAGAGAESARAPEAASLLDIRVHGEWGRAFIQVKRGGADLLDQVRAQLQELGRQNLDCVYLDLALADPATASHGAALKKLGFFCGGVLPEMLAAGDALRLQHVNKPGLNLEETTLASKRGQEIFDFIKKQYAGIER